MLKFVVTAIKIGFQCEVQVRDAGVMYACVKGLRRTFPFCMTSVNSEVFSCLEANDRLWLFLIFWIPRDIRRKYHFGTKVTCFILFYVLHRSRQILFYELTLFISNKLLAAQTEFSSRSKVK